MNKEQVKGRAEEAVGKVKEVAGHVTGDKELEAKGDAQQVTGKVRSTAGDTVEDVKDVVKG
ncbi:MAG: CsbD family protein, partial [Burkholderiaceae bacterium]